MMSQQQKVTTDLVEIWAFKLNIVNVSKSRKKCMQVTKYLKCLLCLFLLFLTKFGINSLTCIYVLSARLPL